MKLALIFPDHPFASKALYCLWASLLLAALVIGWHLPTAQAQNVAITTTQNCDNNAVIWCGTTSVDQLIGKYRGGDGRNSATSIHNILDFFGISATDVNSMNSNAVTVVAGQVSKTGEVFDNQGDVVATNALTAGRQDIAGSTQVVSNGTVFFTRPPSVSFLSDRLAAYVVMVNGKFAFAILASCGNPIKATPKVTPAPTPAPTPPPQAASPPAAPTSTTPQATTVSVCSGSTTNTATTSANSGSAQGGNCSTNVVNNSSPPPTSASTTQSPPTPMCEALGVSLGDNRTVTINNLMTNIGNPTTTTSAMNGAASTATTASNTTDNATFTSADINWGDGTSVTGVTNPIGQTHQYTTDATFTISVVAHFQLNGQDVTAGGAGCQQQVSFSTATSAPAATPTTPTPTATPSSTPTTAPASPAPSTPTPPATLVNTGTSDLGLTGLFGVTTVIGALGYRFWLTRRTGVPR